MDRKRLGGSSVARIAGNVLSGLITSKEHRNLSDVAKADLAFSIALHIVQRAEKYDEQLATGEGPFYGPEGKLK